MSSSEIDLAVAAQAAPCASSRCGAGPPAATTADSSVDWLGSVKTPGRCAGPTTKTLTARSWPSETLRLKLVYSRPICARRWCSRSDGLDAGDIEAADLRQVELAVAVDAAAVVDVDRAPGAQEDLVARADDVVGRDRHVVERVTGSAALSAKKRLPNGGSSRPVASFDEFLEFARRCGCRPVLRRLAEALRSGRSAKSSRRTAGRSAPPRTASDSPPRSALAARTARAAGPVDVGSTGDSRA